LNNDRFQSATFFSAGLVGHGHSHARFIASSARQETARFLNRWATFTLDGDPSLDKRWQLSGSFRYPRGTGKAARLAAHHELADRLDAMGERGMGLTLALESIFHDLEVRRIIEPTVMDDSAKHPPPTTSFYQKHSALLSVWNRVSPGASFGLISTRSYAASAASRRDTALATSVTPKTTSDMFDTGAAPQ